MRRYISESVIGHLYRQVLCLDMAVEVDSSSEMDVSLVYPNSEEFLKEASELYEDYVRKMEAIMRCYGITEVCFFILQTYI